MNKKQIIENKIRKIVKEVLKEGPNEDAQIRIVKSMKSLCENFLKGNEKGLIFLQKMQNEIKSFKVTTGSK